MSETRLVESLLRGGAAATSTESLLRGGAALGHMTPQQSVFENHEFTDEF